VLHQGEAGARRAGDGREARCRQRDVELVLQTLQCTIFTDSPAAEERIDRLEAAFGELRCAIRP
jgi:hypothetical protein